jgi:small-conductance mechanosensitive channel
MPRFSSRVKRGLVRSDSTTSRPSRPISRRGLVCAVSAGAALAVDSLFGGASHHSTREKLIALVCALAFLFLAVLAVRGTANRVSEFVSPHASRATGEALRLTLVTVGYMVVFFVTLGMLGVSAQRLLVGGAVTGVIVGIAAQQSLGNVFAGLVLMLARPFAIGERVRVRSGALGGIFEGTVLGMSLTYVTMEIDDGILHLPNATLLAGAVGPAPLPPVDRGAPAPEPDARTTVRGPQGVKWPRQVVH